MAKKLKKPKTSTKIKRAPAAPVRIASALDYLKKRRALNVFEHTAADEILMAYQIEHGMPVARDPDLGLPGMPSADAADAGAARRMDVVNAYRDWLRDVRGTPAMWAVQTIVLGGCSFRAVDSQMRWRKGTAKKNLYVGLRHFAVLRGNFPRGAHDWRLCD